MKNEKTNNLNDVKVMARKLLIENGLDDWDVVYDNAKKRFGQCRYSRKQISLSRNLVSLNSEEIVRNTILHEIAHALVGPRNGHNLCWRIQARKIGAKPERCYGEEVATPEPKYVGVCNNCGREMKWYKKTKRRYACGRCCDEFNGGRFSEKYVVECKKIN